MKNTEAENGLFIVFEGIDGCGKTTQVRNLSSYLSGKKLPFTCLVEPTQGFWGQKALNLILKGRGNTTPEEELSYFVNDRRENVEKNILPALKQGKIIVQDRYYFSTAAYQGALNLDFDFIVSENLRFAPTPDFVFFLDIDLDTAMQRIQNRKGVLPNHFEKREYLEKVRNNYLKFKLPHFHRMDGTQSPERIFQSMENLLEPALGRIAAKS